MGVITGLNYIWLVAGYRLLVIVNDCMIIRSTILDFRSRSKIADR